MSSVQYPSRVAIDARATENSELHCCVYLDRHRYTALCRTTDTHSVLCGRLPVRATLTLEIHRQHVRHVVRTISKPRSDRCTGHRENHLTVTDHPLFTKQHYGFAMFIPPACNPPVPWKGKSIEQCCAPAKGGCACDVGYGNTLQLNSSGDLLTATSYYNASVPNQPFFVDVTRWRLPR